MIESPRGCSVKLKYNSELGAMAISRPLALGLVYPYDWGFVPSTKGPDGDPLDALVFWDVSSFPGVVIPCRALGIVQIDQNREGHPGERVRNDRLVAAPAVHRRADLHSVILLPQRVRDELAHFVVATTVFEGKDPRILGWDGPDAALRLIHSTAV